MLEVLVDDTARIAHLIAVAIGFGIAVETEIFASKQLRGRVGASFLADLEKRHFLISVALIAMWVTGLALVGLRTGYDMALFSPKLTAKVATVSILTCNSLLISTAVLPALRANLDKPLSALPMRKLLLLFSVAGFSAGSWIFAMMLGGAASLKTAPELVFQIGVPLVYGLSVPAAIIIGFRLVDVPLNLSEIFGRQEEPIKVMAKPPRSTDHSPESALRDALLGRD